MDSKLILVVIGVIGAAFECSEAITCYKCNTWDDKTNCSDPFSSMDRMKVSVCEGVTCLKETQIQFGKTIIYRECRFDPIDKDLCTNVTEEGIPSIKCLCRTDYCNDGRKVKPTACNVIVGVAMATVVSIAWMK